MQERIFILWYEHAKGTSREEEKNTDIRYNEGQKQKLIHLLEHYFFWKKK